jgi:hypothetical protein
VQPAGLGARSRVPELRSLRLVEVQLTAALARLR